MMKALSELVISPAPWIAEDNLKSFPLSSCSVRCDAYDVAQNVLPSDARLIAAAPELYFHLHAALLLCGMRKCVSENTLSLWRSALAKAAGEEVAND